jgi:hypothetical protein
MLHMDEAETFLSFFLHEARLMPMDHGMRVKDIFFVLRSAAPERLLGKLARLKSWVARVEEEIAGFEVPQWISDFWGYFDWLVGVAVDKVDPLLSYAEPLAGEVEISRSIFSDLVGTSVSKRIDEVVDIALAGNASEFVRRAIELSKRLIPDGEMQTATEQSVGMLFFFRVIFDRFWERRGAVPQSAWECQKRLMRMARVPLKRFHFPIELDDAEQVEVPIAQYFAKDVLFRSSGETLSEVLFACNPVDALFMVHKALLEIHDAALTKWSKGTKLTEENLIGMLCFDDLFALLVGVVLASDIPDFFAFAEFIEIYTPQNQLSNSLEYAQAAVASLLLHFGSVDIDALEEQK